MPDCSNATTGNQLVGWCPETTVASADDASRDALVVGDGGGSTAVLEAISYWIVFVVGVVGNILVLALAVWRCIQKQTVTQLFVASQCLSHLGLLFGATWTSAITVVRPDWPYGAFLCKSRSLWIMLSASTSVCVMAVSSVDRCLVLRNPGSSSFTRREAAVILCIVWLSVFVINIPMYIWTNIVEYGPNVTLCVSYVNGNQQTMAVQNLVQNLFVFFVPLAVTLLYNAWTLHLTMLVTRKTAPCSSPATNSIQPDDAHHHHHHHQLQQQTRIDVTQSPAPDDPPPPPPPTTLSLHSSSVKAVRISCLLAAVLTVAWTPLQLLLLVLPFTRTTIVARSTVSPLLLLANLNGCVSPVVYGVMWRPARMAQICGGMCRR